MLTLKPLHIIVPGAPCEKICLFCATRKYILPSKTCLDKGSQMYPICQQDYLKRLSFARDAGHNAIFLRGNCEPQSNRNFLEQIALLNRKLPRPFNLLELFTCGYEVTREYLYLLRSEVGLTNISLELASFKPSINAEYMGKTHTGVDLYNNIKLFHDLRFLLTLRIYSTKEFEIYRDNPGKLFKDIYTQFGARRVFLNNISTPAHLTDNPALIDKVASLDAVNTMYNYVTQNGRFMGKRADGTAIYSIDELKVLIPSSYLEPTKTEGLLVLKPDTHLYTDWTDNGSIIF